MATSGGFGGGPTLPLGDNMGLSALVMILLIAALVFVVTRVFDF